MHWHFLIAFILTAFAGTAPAHVGDRLYSIFELTDEDLTRINLHDGSADDWSNVLGEPSLTTRDFTINTFAGDAPDYDSEDLDFKIWLSWHQATGRIYVVGANLFWRPVFQRGMSHSDPKEIAKTARKFR